jgi:pyrimidine-nucleoside phosphorylase
MKIADEVPRDAPSVVALIEKKKLGGTLDRSDLAHLVHGYLDESIPDYQISAWLMAVRLRGMTSNETLALTLEMVASGSTLDWTGLDGPIVDKHSTGGVGDKTSLVLVPLMAATGVRFVKMSGRGLGHTGGTLDKLESIPGFRVDLSPHEIRAQVERIGCALVGQSPDLVPADGAFYALRDVTATVDSIPLIASSIMSKKLAAGAGVIVLDVKYGSGAILESREEARELARAMVEIGTGAGRQVRALLSGMDQPLGRAVGNALEVREAIETLHGGGPADLVTLTLGLGAQLLMMAGLADSPDRACDALREHLDSGAAAERFRALIEAQGGDPRVVDEPDRLPSAPIVEAFVAPASGWIEGFDARAVADAALALGAGRRHKDDSIDPAVGVEVLARIGDRVETGDELARIHARMRAQLEEAMRHLVGAVRISPEPVPAPETAPELIG